jgi:hypothetical protein
VSVISQEIDLTYSYEYLRDDTDISNELIADKHAPSKLCRYIVFLNVDYVLL